MAKNCAKQDSPPNSHRGELECPICHNEYTQPKMLPCTHLACRNCLVAWLQPQAPPTTNGATKSVVGRSSAGAGGVTLSRPSSARSTTSTSSRAVSVMSTSTTTTGGEVNGTNIEHLKGCPVCKSPILPQGQGQGEGQQFDLVTLVDALPTDMTTVATLESQRVLSSCHLCIVCENGVQAVSYCLQCEAKLCQNCALGHRKLPALKNHEVEDITALTVQRLVEHYLSSCRAHEDRPAEFYCLAHYELICMLCASTNHRGCPEVKAVAEVAVEKREEMKQHAEKLRDREKILTKQVREVKDRFKVVRKKAKDTFDELQQEVKARRQEVNAMIQAEEDVTMASVGQLERHRSAVKSHASTTEKMADGAPDVALLDMLGKLTSRLTELDQQGGTMDKLVANQNILDVVFDQQKLAHLKTALSGFGRVTSSKPKTRWGTGKSGGGRSTSPSCVPPTIPNI